MRPVGILSAETLIFDRRHIFYWNLKPAFLKSRFLWYNMNVKYMKILGIDYGEKRIGLAISDETMTLARELDILSPKEFWGQVNKLISDQQISKIVIGWPLNMSGEETQKTREVESFKLKVESETGLPVEIIDERLSSQMAEHISGSKKNLDSLAAQILLQNYLDKQK
jgi:putative Holliday junction resolvase